MVQNKKKNTKVVKDFAEELWEKQLEPLYLLRPIRGLPVLPSARLNVETAGFEPKRFVRTQPFLSRSVEKRADQSRFKSIGLYINALCSNRSRYNYKIEPWLANKTLLRLLVTDTRGNALREATREVLRRCSKNTPS